MFARSSLKVCRRDRYLLVLLVGVRHVLIGGGLGYLAEHCKKVTDVACLAAVGGHVSELFEVSLLELVVRLHSPASFALESAEPWASVSRLDLASC
jgi:hypothetical protein